MGRGWAEIARGAEHKVPRVFYFVIKYVTPLLLFVILLQYTIQPAGMVEGKEKGWEPYVESLFTGKSPPEWEWSGSGMIGKLMHKDLALPSTASDEQREYMENLKLARTVDRAAMVLTFAFFATLVYWAWRKRRAEGRA
jgi:hypothetical protein